ncbi:MAG TPA: hypothetical protein ENK10_04670 [Acidobacteria bacterium]|nr:hypothetical protein [Acidobacteriota bacterium]
MGQWPRVVLIDGYNVLLTLAERERTRLADRDLPAAVDRLTTLLGQWAALRESEVVLVWDRCPGSVRGTEVGLRVVRIDPPAEADDWIVAEAGRLSRAGRPVAVVTADRGLIARLPESARAFPPRHLEGDLQALVSGPLGLPDAGVALPAGEIPASSDPVDPRTLPRRRQPRQEQPLSPMPTPTRPPPPAGTEATANDRQTATRQAARAERERRRERYLRRQRRRKRR